MNFITRGIFPSGFQSYIKDGQLINFPGKNILNLALLMNKSKAGWQNCQPANTYFPVPIPDYNMLRAELIR